MKRYALNSIAAFTLLFAVGVSQTATAQSHSKYAGQEIRSIKSLSSKDVAELRRGGGWGFAKVAELNGIPGPIHLLEMKDQIALSADQVARITAIYERMRAEATTLGEEFIQSEADLDRSFRDGSISEASLASKLEQISSVRAKLRNVHLSAHLKVRPILTLAQVTVYNRLRGYSQSNPCTSPPKGHDVEMWRKHNNCD